MAQPAVLSPLLADGIDDHLRHKASLRLLGGSEASADAER
jgi:hypothetical protein